MDKNIIKRSAEMRGSSTFASAIVLALLFAALIGLCGAFGSEYQAAAADTEAEPTAEGIVPINTDVSAADEETTEKSGNNDGMYMLIAIVCCVGGMIFIFFSFRKNRMV